MLYDLSLVWTPSTTAAQIDSTLAMSAELGYDVVALDHVYHGPVPTAAVTNPLPVLPAPAVPATSASSSSSAQPAPAPPRRPRVLRRATVVVSDTTLNHRLAAVAAAYDLVAVRPTTEKAFQAACLSMAEPALISLDLATYFPFFFRHRAAMAAVRRGVHFEVCYGQALGPSAAVATADGNDRRGGGGSGGGGDRNGSADRARALFVANLVGLVRATRGRGIVISSGARLAGAGGGGGGSASSGALELRAPADVVNLLAVWGVAPDRAAEGLSALPRSIVANEGLRRRGFRGVVDIVQGVQGVQGAAVTAPATAEEQKSRKDKSKQQQPKQQQQKQQQPKQQHIVERKRKATDAGPTDPALRPPQQQGQRQAKKPRKGPGSG